MKEIPILFSTPMVQAILEGIKTMTRRVIKYKKKIENPEIGWTAFGGDREFSVRGVHENGQFGESLFKMPYQKEDILWVRETYCPTLSNDMLHKDTKLPFFYKADISKGNELMVAQTMRDYGYKWKPSIFMPKSACRIFLKITDVRVERLQDISNSDIRNEGACQFGSTTYRLDFETLWESINGKESWKLNPWVWVIEFERINL